MANVRIDSAEYKIVWFGNGTSARIMEGKNIGLNSYGEPMTRLILYPTEYFRNIHDIKSEELENGTLFIYDVPTKYLQPLSPHSPTNNVTLCWLDGRKRPTNLMNRFLCFKCGKEYDNVFDDLRAMESAVNSKEKQIANLKGEIKSMSESLKIDLSEESKRELIDEFVLRMRQLLGGSQEQMK